MEHFRIIIASLPDRERVVAEIWYDNIQWIEISQETDQLIIEFYSYPMKKYWEFSYNETYKYLKRARNKLLSLPDTEASEELYHLMSDVNLEWPCGEYSTNRFDILATKSPEGQAAVEIHCNNMPFANISIIKGELIIQFYPPQNAKYWHLLFDEAITALEEARNKLFGLSNCDNTEL